MTCPTYIYLVRHGAIENPEQVFYGRLGGFPLSAQGRMEAQAAANALSEVPLAAIFSSPQERALQTAEIIAARHDGLAVSVCEWINEIHTPYDGWPMGKVIERGWDVYTGNKPPFETPAGILARVRQFIAWARQQYGGQHVAAVTHGDPIVFLLLWAKGMSVTPGDRLPMYRQYAAKGSVTRLTFVTESEDELPAIGYRLPVGEQSAARNVTRTPI